MARIQLAEKLEQLGFTSNEAHVYLILLEVGRALPSTLARELGVNRSSIYGILKRLMQKNVVVEEREQAYSYFRAIEPKRFLETQKKQLLELNRNLKELERKLPIAKPTANSKSIQNELSNSLKTLLEKSRASLKIIRSKDLQENEKIHILENLQEEVLSGFLELEISLSIPE